MRLVADANVLLSALVGGRAQQILVHPEVKEVLAAAPVLDEVREYLGELAEKRRLALDTVLLALAALPVVVVPPDVYAAETGEAERRIGQRDPDDVDTLALALHSGLPIWSNDSDFENAGVVWYTTARLLKRLAPAEG